METDRLIAPDGEEWAANTILSSLKLILPNDLIQLPPPIFIIIWGKRARDKGDGYEQRSEKEYVLWRGEITEWLEQIWIFLTQTQYYAVWQQYQSFTSHCSEPIYSGSATAVMRTVGVDLCSGPDLLPPASREKNCISRYWEPGLVYFLQRR